MKAQRDGSVKALGTHYSHKKLATVGAHGKPQTWEAAESGRSLELTGWLAYLIAERQDSESLCLKKQDKCCLRNDIQGDLHLRGDHPSQTHRICAGFCHH